MAVKNSGAENAPRRPPALKNSIKQKTADIRRVSNKKEGYEVVLMSRDTETDCPENHHQKIVEEEMNELMHRLDCKTVEQVQEKLPKNVSGMPCQGEGVTVWIAHTQPGPFGWEISCLANSNFTRTEQ